MDFGDILNEWDNIKRERKETPERLDRRAPGQPEPPRPKNVPSKREASPAVNKALEAWLDAHEVEAKDVDREADLEERRDRESAEARRLAAMKCQDVLDLHGMKAEEAQSAIEAFIEASSRKGLMKVLVIHGKGLHSEAAPVLKKVARRTIEASPLAGRYGEAAKEEGGSGALWVLIRANK
jgi:DNA-nicking Smr family endonuclease